LILFGNDYRKYLEQGLRQGDLVEMKPFDDFAGSCTIKIPGIFKGLV
jgi:hypothetical protein